MGIAFSAGIQKAAPSIFGGIGSAILGAATLNPILAIAGAATAFGGAISGAMAASDAQNQINAGKRDQSRQAQISRDAAVRQNTIDAIAAKAAEFHANVAAEAKRGAYGPDAKKSMMMFAQLVAGGKTLLGATTGTGGVLGSGYGNAINRRTTQAMDKYMTSATGGIMSPSTALKFGDPTHMRAGYLLAGAAGSAGRAMFSAAKQQGIRDIFNNFTQPPPPQQQPDLPYAPDSASYESRMLSGSIQTRRDGTFSAQSAG